MESTAVANLAVGWSLGQILAVEGRDLAVVRQAVLLIPALGERNALVSQDHTEAQALAAPKDCLTWAAAREAAGGGGRAGRQAGMGQAGPSAAQFRMRAGWFLPWTVAAVAAAAGA